MEYFDAHAHYDDERFNIDRDKLVKEVYESGVTKIISAGYSLAGSKEGLALAKKYSFIYTTVGISPNDISEKWEEDVIEIENLLKSELKNGRIVAVGEIGLDYHYDTDKELQKQVFKKQIKLANKYELPIVIHTRDAVMDTLSILKENPVRKTGVFHCCPHNRELVKEALKLGYYISFGGTSTFKNSKNAEEIVNMVPLDQLVTETDCPYLAPEPVRGTRNDSRNLKYIVKRLAEFKGIAEERLAKEAYENAKRVYGLI